MAVSLEQLARLARGQASLSAGAGNERDAPHRLVHERAAGQDAKANITAANPTAEAFYWRGVVDRQRCGMCKTHEGNAAFLIGASVGIGALGSNARKRCQDSVSCFKGWYR
jgi:hypothetical protein